MVINGDHHELYFEIARCHGRLESVPDEAHEARDRGIGPRGEGERGTWNAGRGDVGMAVMGCG